MELEAGELIGAKYRLERPLARGGMGEVWIARHVDLDVDVAIKFIQAAAQHAKAGARFRAEARAAAQLKSPHVVRVYDYGLHEDAPYLAMEFLEGQDLQSRIDSQGVLPPQHTLLILEQAAKALGVAHSAGIVHRDIKPSNLFLAREGGDEVLKVLDFGIAKLEQPDGATTSQGVLLGSPAYMSPEQARGYDVDQRSDLWSLGVVAFELLSGVSPFSGATVGDSIAKICWEPLPRIHARMPELPERYQSFFDRALCRDRTKRFQTAEELVEHFREVVSPNAELSGAMPARSSLISSPSGTDWGRSEPTLELTAPPVVDRQEGASLEASSHQIHPPSRPRWVLPTAVLVLGALALGSAAYFTSTTRVRPELAAPSADLAPSAGSPEQLGLGNAESGAAPSASATVAVPSATAVASGTTEPRPKPSASVEPPKPAAPARAKPPAGLAPAKKPRSGAVGSEAPPEKAPPKRDDTFGI